MAHLIGNSFANLGIAQPWFNRQRPQLVESFFRNLEQRILSYYHVCMMTVSAVGEYYIAIHFQSLVSALERGGKVCAFAPAKCH